MWIGRVSARASRWPGRSASRRNTTSRMRGISFFPAPSLVCPDVPGGACGYGEPALRAPVAAVSAEPAMGRGQACRAPVQARTGQPHGGAGTAPALHRDIQRGATAAKGDRAQSALGEIETQ
jgi:hypothetical protein